MEIDLIPMPKGTVMEGFTTIIRLSTVNGKQRVEMDMVPTHDMDSIDSHIKMACRRFGNKMRELIKERETNVGYRVTVSQGANDGISFDFDTWPTGTDLHKRLYPAFMKSVCHKFANALEERQMLQVPLPRAFSLFITLKGIEATYDVVLKPIFM